MALPEKDQGKPMQENQTLPSCVSILIYKKFLFKDIPTYSWGAWFLGIEFRYSWPGIEAGGCDSDCWMSDVYIDVPIYVDGSWYPLIAPVLSCFTFIVLPTISCAAASTAIFLFRCRRRFTNSNKRPDRETRMSSAPRPISSQK